MIVHNSLVSVYQHINFETSNDIVSIISYHEIINTSINQISFILNKKKTMYNQTNDSLSNERRFKASSTSCTLG